VVAGPDVEQIWYGNPAEERRLISRRLNAILSDGIKPQDIVVLSKRTRERGCLHEGLESVVYDLAELGEETGHRRRESIPFATVSAYKGLEADVVFLVDVDDLRKEDSLAALYVGASRARALLVVFLADSVRTDYELRAREYGQRLSEASVE
jgi:superfamily I DNA/RNA helicase